MNLSELKTGDRIKYLRYGHALHEATVIKNFPTKRKVYLRVNFGWLGNSKELFNYDAYNFDLIR